MIKKIYLKTIIRLKRLLRRDTNDAQIALFRQQGYSIGEKCRIFSNLGAAEPFLVNIGNNVTISSDVKFLTHDNSIIKASNKKYTDLFGKIDIGDNVFIGAGAIILPGVNIEKNTIVAAGSVIVKSVEECGKVIGGNPATIIGDVDKYLKKNEDNAFDMKGKSRSERKNTILENTDKLIKRPKMSERSKK